MRFLSVQLATYISGDLWLRNARHANVMARRLRDGLGAILGVRFRGPTEMNFVLVTLPQPIRDGLVAEGYTFSRRGAASERTIRSVCAFGTTEEDVDALVATAKRYAGRALEAV